MISELSNRDVGTKRDMNRFPAERLRHAPGERAGWSNAPKRDPPEEPSYRRKTEN